MDTSVIVSVGRARMLQVTECGSQRQTWVAFWAKTQWGTSASRCPHGCVDLTEASALLQRSLAAWAGRETATRRLETDDSICERAEAAHAALVQRGGVAFDRITNVRAGTSHYLIGEGIAGLHFGYGEYIVDQARLSLRRRRRASSAGAQIVERVRIAFGRICRVIADFSCIDGTNRRDRGGLVCRDTCTEQVRDRDSSDDQDDRHHDQQ